MWVLVFSAVAYFAAIGAKAAFQALTFGPLDAAVGGDPWVLGPYFGIQTAFLEVGGAYLAARYAVSRGLLRANDAEGYGVGLALWENGVFIAGVALIEYLVYYFTLSGSGQGALQTYAALSQDVPSLFYPATRALGLVGYQVLERVSSLLLHFSWGYLCVLAAVFRKRSLVLLALPMGLVDFFVPFEGSFGLGAFEALIFAIGLASVGVALASTKGEYRRASVDFSSAPATHVGANLRQLLITNIRRAFNFGKVYVIMGLVVPLLFIAELSVASSAARASSAGGAGIPVLGEVYPLLLPVFVLLGSSGAMMIFTSDKEKGVYEYMLAYGVDVQTIFLSVTVAALALVTLVLAGSLAIGVTALAATNPGALSLTFFELILVYTIPLSYSATMFMSMAGMIWSQLTTRRPGVNSPLGIAPMLGIAPVLVVLLLALGPGSAHLILVVGVASVGMVWAVVLMTWVASTKMQRERFISSG